VPANFNTDLKGLGKLIADSFKDLDLSDFNETITLTGARSSELIGYVRSQSDRNIKYFPTNTHIIGKEINLDNYIGFK